MERYVARALTCSALIAGMVGFAGAAWSQSESEEPDSMPSRSGGSHMWRRAPCIPGYAYQDASGANGRG